MTSFSATTSRTQILIEDGPIKLHGCLDVPPETDGLVLFAHGSGSGRHSPRNQQVAEVLQDKGLATLLFDLLTEEEERKDTESGRLRSDIPFLADRLRLATAWTRNDPELAGLPLGYFGASTGAAAALIAAAQEGNRVRAVVSRSCRPDLAGEALSQVRASTLLIVGSEAPAVLALNQKASDQLRTEKWLEVVPGASHLFEEPGTLDAAAELAGLWFWAHFAAKRRTA